MSLVYPIMKEKKGKTKFERHFIKKKKINKIERIRGTNKERKEYFLLPF